MLHNYFIIAWRNLMRNSVYSIINIAGLSVGIACSILILLWVSAETSYDTFQPKYNQLYKVYYHSTRGDGNVTTHSGSSYVAYEELSKSFSQIKNTSVTEDLEKSHLLTLGKKLVYKNGIFVSPEFLEMFEFELLKGSRKDILNAPNSIVITESTAKLFFEDQDPINKIIRLDNESELKVVGVLKDVPANSSFQFDFLVPFRLLQNTKPAIKDCVNDKDCAWFNVYVELSPDINVEDFNNQKELIHSDGEYTDKIFLYPMSRWSLHGEFENGIEYEEYDQGSVVNNFTWIAIAILIIACINFMNLSTARSERRAREVGLRKIAGSQRIQLIIQFLGESTLLVSISFFLAIVLVELLLPLYNTLLHTKLVIDYSSPSNWIAGLSIILLTGLIAGSYPAFYLSSFQPSKVLKGKLHIGRNASFPRKILVIAQFAFSTIMIVSTITIYYQIQFVQNRELGYNNQNLITLPDNNEMAKSYKAIKEELLNTVGIVSVTKSNSPITDVYEYNYLDWPGNRGDKIEAVNIFADYDYIKTMGIKLVEGRDFSENKASDAKAIIVNQEAIRVMNLQKPIGSKISVGDEPFEVIGITENIVMRSAYYSIEPLYMVLETKWQTQNSEKNITVRIDRTKDLQGIVGKIESVVKKHCPSFPFTFSFAEDDFNAKFQKINRMGSLVAASAFLAILISCLGLFGLAAFAAEKRTKEIGIRKVLGATATNLVTMMSNDFLWIVIKALVIASPITWYAMNTYLKRYSYRVDFPWWALLVSGALTIVIALTIVSTQALKAANQKPVESLKSE